MLEWNDSMSDGCSVQKLKKYLPAFLVPPDTPEQCAACIAHDRDYYYGGSREVRRMADEMLRRRLIAAGKPVWLADFYWVFCRLLGGPKFWKFTTWVFGRPQGWAWGVNIFKYTEAP